MSVSNPIYDDVIELQQSRGAIDNLTLNPTHNGSESPQQNTSDHPAEYENSTTHDGSQITDYDSRIYAEVHKSPYEGIHTDRSVEGPYQGYHNIQPTAPAPTLPHPLALLTTPAPALLDPIRPPNAPTSTIPHPVSSSQPKAITVAPVVQSANGVSERLACKRRCVVLLVAVLVIYTAALVVLGYMVRPISTRNCLFSGNHGT